MALSSRILLSLLFLGLIVPMCFAASPSAGVRTVEESESQTAPDEDPDAFHDPLGMAEPQVDAGEAVKEGEQGGKREEIEQGLYQQKGLGYLHPRAQSVVRKVRSVVQKRPAGTGVAAGAVALIGLCALLLSAGKRSLQSAEVTEDLSARVAHTVKNNKVTAMLVGTMLAAAAAAYILQYNEYFDFTFSG